MLAVVATDSATLSATLLMDAPPLMLALSAMLLRRLLPEPPPSKK